MNYGLIVIFPTLTGEKFRAFDKSVKKFDGVKIPLSRDIFVTFPQKMLWGGGDLCQVMKFRGIISTEKNFVTPLKFSSLSLEIIFPDKL